MSLTGRLLDSFSENGAALGEMLARFHLTSSISVDRRVAETDEVVTTWVTASELFFGAAKSMKPDANAGLVVRFLTTLPVLAPDLASARVFGEVKARLSAEGQIVADADLFIGSIALSRGATVVTGNRRHYERIPGLVVEDWLRP